jgi:hypothetical protein
VEGEGFEPGAAGVTGIELMAASSSCGWIGSICSGGSGAPAGVNREEELGMLGLARRPIPYPTEIKMTTAHAPAIHHPAFP